SVEPGILPAVVEVVDGVLGVAAGAGVLPALLLLELLDPQPAAAMAITATAGTTERLIHLDMLLLLAGRLRLTGLTRSVRARSGGKSTRRGRQAPAPLLQQRPPRHLRRLGDAQQ